MKVLQKLKLRKQQISKKSAPKLLSEFKKKKPLKDSD